MLALETALRKRMAFLLFDTAEVGNAGTGSHLCF